MINLCNAQKILDDIEMYMFQQIFKPENSISAFIELNESNDTTRHWQFNKDFKLIKEIDNRPSAWPYSAGWSTSSRPSKKVYEYNYHKNGTLDSINEMHTSLGELISNTYLFAYPNKNTIIESYELKVKELFNMQFELTQIMKDANIDESFQIMKSHTGSGYVQAEQRLKYIYAEQLTEINHYFRVNSYPLNNEEELMNEILGAKTIYSYDQFNRLKRIVDFEYNETGDQKTKRDAIFTYYEQSNNISKIKLLYGENDTSVKVDYKIEYDMNGDISTITVNNKTYRYITKR